MKVYIGILVFAAVQALAVELNSPSYEGYYFLANTPEELRYASVPPGQGYHIESEMDAQNEVATMSTEINYASTPTSARDYFAYRAQTVCKFMGYGPAIFARTNSATVNPGYYSVLLNVDDFGFAQVGEYPVIYNRVATYFTLLRCR